MTAEDQSSGERTETADAVAAAERAAQAAEQASRAAQQATQRQDDPRHGHRRLAFERGWPFSIVDLLRDLRYDVSDRGFLLGVPTWVVGQTTRFDEIVAASKVKGREAAMESRLHEGRLSVSNTGGAVFAFVTFYVRLVVLALGLLLLPTLVPLLLFALLALVSGDVGVAAGYGLLGAFGAVGLYWLRFADDDERPGATMA